MTEDRKVRVRIYEEDERATITIKAKTGRIRNAEFVYDIPLADAEELVPAEYLIQRLEGLGDG
jgi:CYTH domain-containing protein